MKGELERKTTFWSMERMKKERRKARGKTGWKDEKKEAWRPGSESKSLIFLPGEKYLNLFTVLQLSWMSGRLTAVMLKARCIMGAVVECYDTQTSIKRLEAECERNCRLWDCEVLPDVVQPVRSLQRGQPFIIRHWHRRGDIWNPNMTSEPRNYTHTQESIQIWSHLNNSYMRNKTHITLSQSLSI